MARTLKSRTHLKTASDCSTSYIVLFALILLLLMQLTTSQQSGVDDDEATSPVCPRNRFPCYRDCCVTGEMFCHNGQQRCVHCDTRKPLCGNESLPLECLLYCYKTDHVPLDSSDCFILTTLITSILATMVLSVALTLAVLAVCARKTLSKWPPCLHTWLGLNTPTYSPCDAEGDKDHDTARENSMLPNNDPTMQDVDAGRPPNHHDGSSSSSNNSLQGIDKSSTITSLNELNVTRVIEDDEEGEEAPVRRPSDDCPQQPPGGCSTNSQGPGQGQTTAISSGEGTLPSEGRHEAAGSCAGGPQAPGTSPQGAENMRGAEDGIWMEPRLPANPEGRGPTYHSPAAGSDIREAHGGLPGSAPREGPHQSGSHSGNNEVLTKPNFSHMNPTPGTDNGNDGCHLATGTDNPAKFYDINDHQYK